jgi:predicted transcriptional regulator
MSRDLLIDRSWVRIQIEVMRVRAADLMQTEAEYLMSGQTVEHAARRMRDKALRFLPVCRGDKLVLGLVTERDIVIRGVANARALELCAVDEVMTREFAACGPDTILDAITEPRWQDEALPLVVLDPANRLLGTLVQGVRDRWFASKRSAPPVDRRLPEPTARRTASQG